MDPPPPVPPPPPHDFFAKPNKTAAGAAARPSAPATASSSTSTSSAIASTSTAAPATVPGVKKRKPKAPAVDPKQGQLSFASGSGLGVVVPPPAVVEPDNGRKGKARAKATDGEQAEIQQMAGAKKKAPAARKKAVGQSAAVEEDKSGGGARAATAARDQATASASSSTSSSSHPLPPATQNVSSTSTQRQPPSNKSPSLSVGLPSNLGLGRQSTPDPTAVRLPSAVPSPLRMIASPSKTESVDLTQDDTDDDNQPSVASRPRPTLKLKRGAASKQATLTIGSSSESEIESSDQMQQHPKQRKPPAARRRGVQLRLSSDEEPGTEEIVASGSSAKANAPRKPKEFAIFSKPTKKVQGSFTAPIDLEPPSSTSSKPAARRRMQRSPSIIDLDQSSPVKRSSAANPIVITSSSQPSSSKPVHSFFAKRKPATFGGGVGSEIAGAGKTVKALPPMEPRWPTREEVHVGFAWGGSSEDKKGKGREREVFLGRYDAANYPDASSFWDAPCTSTARPPTAQRLQAFLSTHQVSVSFSQFPPSQASTIPFHRTLPPHVLAHPAFARLLSRSFDPQPPQPPSKHPDELWVDKYKPRAADQVLGNEVESVYLRDWLVALQVQGKARQLAREEDEDDDEHPPRAGGRKGKAMVVPSKRKQPEPVARRDIVRKVVKPKREKRKKSKHGYGEGDWIANSSEEDDVGDPIVSDFDSDDDGLVPPTTGDDHQSAHSPPPPLHHHDPTLDDTVYPSLSHLLTNSILLVGPPGSGKTASVYACAAELGWEVFEVYPGVGKRSGTALASLVGDMSKNHIVGQGGTGGGSSVGALKGGGLRGSSTAPTTNAFSVLMKGKGAPTTTSAGASVHDAIPLDVDEAADTTRSPTPHPPTSPSKQSKTLIEPAKVRQSLILIEEVDILFAEEDKGFWQGLVALIAESRRPVVMTCNNLQPIPLHELPLQAILYYSPPPPSLAIPYLTLLAHAQKFHPFPGSMEKLYTTSAVYRTPGAGMIDVVGHPAPSQENDGPDLRRAIGAMQLGWADGTDAEEGFQGSVGDLVDELEREGREWEVELLDWASGGSKFLHAEVPMDVDPTATSPPIPTPTTSAPSSLQTLLAISRLTDHLSHLTAHLVPRTTTLMDLEEIDRYAPSGDDEAGWDLLVKWTDDPVDGPAVLAGTGWEREMGVEMGLRAREEFDGVVGEGTIVAREGGLSGRAWSESEMREARASHLSSLLTFLSPLISPPTPLLPSPALITSHAPYIRHLLATDDLLLASESAQPSRLKRPSARAALVALAVGRAGHGLGVESDVEGGGKGMGGGGGRWGGYQRYLVGLGEEELRAVRGSGLDLDW